VEEAIEAVILTYEDATIQTVVNGIAGF